MSSDLDVTALVKTFKGFRAVDGVSFSVPVGSFFSILGPSGCGKTTIMRMIAGFAEPDSGDIAIKGSSILGVKPNHRPVNMVFQHLALFPMMSVAENIAYGLKRKGVGRAERDERIKKILERVGLPDAGYKRIDQLSGGQKQRIAIARCLVLEPTLLLLDEPLGALDLKLREQMKVELKLLQETFGTTFVYITHDQSEALVMSDQVAVMNKGKFEQVGRPQDLYYSPETPFVAGFVGQSNRLEGTVEAVDENARSVRLDDGMPIVVRKPSLTLGERVSLFLRPEAIALATSQEALMAFDNRHVAVVEELMFDGAASSALVKIAGNHREIRVSLPQAGEMKYLSRKDSLWIGWHSDAVLAFGQTNGGQKDRLAAELGATP